MLQSNKNINLYNNVIISYRCRFFVISDTVMHPMIYQQSSPNLCVSFFSQALVVQGMPLHPCLRTSKRFPRQLRKEYYTSRSSQFLLFLRQFSEFSNCLRIGHQCIVCQTEYCLLCDHSIVSFQQNGTHQPYQRFFIREDSDDGRTSLQLFVQSFYMV